MVIETLKLVAVWYMFAACIGLAVDLKKVVHRSISYALALTSTAVGYGLLMHLWETNPTLCWIVFAFMAVDYVIAVMVYFDKDDTAQDQKMLWRFNMAVPVFIGICWGILYSLKTLALTVLAWLA